MSEEKNPDIEEPIEQSEEEEKSKDSFPGEEPIQNEAKTKMN